MTIRSIFRHRKRSLLWQYIPQFPIQSRKYSSSNATSSNHNVFMRRGDRCRDHFRIHSTYHNFRLDRIVRIPEFKIDALELTHTKTCSKYIHIDANDPNNVFSVLFRTPPQSSNGVPHILEHTVLCGSQKFPVRDPFFNMLKRSLNTYMNAMTACDHTMYPFATTNEKDWQHLLAVYLDAVFFPVLNPLDFMQEGHHLQRKSKMALERKGVVLNEMKGVFSDAAQVFSTKAQELSFSDTTYGNVSGGDPKYIPDLTYEELKAFHTKHYHPSNACFYSYGDLPLTQHLAYLDEEILNKFTFQPESASVDVKEPKYAIFQDTKSPLHVIQGPISNTAQTQAESIAAEEATFVDDKANTKFCITKLLDFDSTDLFQGFLMRIASYLLTEGTAAPMYKALIETGLAHDFTSNTGVDTSTYYPSFTIGVEGFVGSEDMAMRLEEAIYQAYQSVMDEGFDPDRVKGLLHQMELGQKHLVGNFGLNLLHSFSSVWCHRGQDLLGCFQFDLMLKRLEEKMKTNPRFLESQVGRFLQSSKTKESKVLMLPSEQYLKNQKAFDAEQLEKLQNTMTECELEQIDRKSKELQEYQQRPQSIDCLPTLTIDDIPREMIKADKDNFTERKLSGASATHSVCLQHVHVPTTHEITYLRFYFDTTSVFSPAERLKYHALLPTFTSVLGALGTSNKSYDTLPTHIQNCSGGISFTPVAYPSLFDAEQHSQQGILVGTYCLPNKLNQNLDLLHQILSDTQFTQSENLAQLRIILQMSALNSSRAISSSGNALAGISSRLGLVDAAFYHELYRGLTQIQFLQHAANCSDEELQRIAKEFEWMAQRIFTTSSLKICTVTEDQLQLNVEKAIQAQLVSKLPSIFSSTSSASWSASFLDTEADAFALQSRKYYGFPMSVNFVVQSFPSVSFSHPDHVPLIVLAQILSSCFIHQHVRERGGAYGSNVTQHEGAFTMSSYFDPNTWSTLETYAAAREWMRMGKFNEQDLQEALLSIFASIDAPTTPANKGRVAFLRGITQAMRQKRREQYLSVSLSELRQIAERYFQPIGEESRSPTVIIGSDAAITEFKDKGFKIGSLI